MVLQGIQKLQEKLFILKGRTIALLGLAFKPETDDLRDAPGLQIAERLLEMGARVNAYDPIAHGGLQAAASLFEDPILRFQPGGGDRRACVVLITEWEEFRKLDLNELAARTVRPIFIDGRNFLSPEAARCAGLDYTGFGRVPPVAGPAPAQSKAKSKVKNQTSKVQQGTCTAQLHPFAATNNRDQSTLRESKHF